MDFPPLLTQVSAVHPTPLRAVPESLALAPTGDDFGLLEDAAGPRSAFFFKHNQIAFVVRFCFVRQGDTVSDQGFTI